MRTLWERAGRPVPLLPVAVIVLAVLATVATPRGIELIRPVAQSGGELRVTTTTDRSPGSCEVDDCTIREALQVAATQPGRTTITLPAGTHQLSVGGSEEDANQAGDLDASGDVILRGAGAGATTIDASGLPTADRVLDIRGGRVELQQVTLTGGAAPSGGGVRVASGAEVVLDRAVLTGNGADTDGGALLLDPAATATVRRSTINGNAAGGYGGGISAGTGAMLTLEATTIDGNGAGLDGGGIEAFQATVAVRTSTLSGNTAFGSAGGMLLEDGSATVEAATLTANVGQAAGGIVAIGTGMAIRHSAIAGNRPAGEDCQLAGAITSLGGNAADASCALGAAGDQVVPGLLVGPLADNGGPTRTHLPDAGSALVDATAGCPPADQRGAPRPVDGDGDGVALCDIGAVERDAVAPPAGGPTPATGPTEVPTPGAPPPGPDDGPAPPPPGDPDSPASTTVVDRLAGADRIATAIAVSYDGWADQAATTVVLARADDFPDALAGTPLAADLDAPLLLTGSTTLDPRVAEELARVLAPGGHVILLGGQSALAAAVEDAVAQLGHTTRRVAGGDRFATSVAIAEALGHPDLLVVASGADFPDAVAAGAATGHAEGAVLLTDGTRLPDVVAQYLAARSGTQVLAVGGPAAGALPDAEGLVGATRIETAVLVAERFFPDGYPATGIATARAFPDALVGGVLLAELGGPVLLSEPDALPDAVRHHLSQAPGGIGRVVLLGGGAALTPAVEEALQEVLG